tara:strand:+ start:222 stop:593 length:372 start_codon:yes stop_codon:yes gene_type:complete
MLKPIVCQNKPPKSTCWNKQLFPFKVGAPQFWVDAEEVPAPMSGNRIVANEPWNMLFEVRQYHVPTLSRGWIRAEVEWACRSVCHSSNRDTMSAQKCGLCIVDNLATRPVIDVFRFIFISFGS